MAKGARGDTDRDFHFVMAAAAYHLAHLSARAYSLLIIVRGRTISRPSSVPSPSSCFATWMRLTTVLDFRLQAPAATPPSPPLFRPSVIRMGRRLRPVPTRPHRSCLMASISALTDSFFAALRHLSVALERGDRALMEEALTRLRQSQDICRELNLLPQWWSHRIGIHLLSDLWDLTFMNASLFPAGGEAPQWPSLRELFIASLFCRTKAEIDLWPSQIDAAARAVNQADDFVVSLPTSAGKTRISELCILRCLASGKRVVFVTPLRALSAQTETTLQATFGPLGKTISALYGSIGVSGFDEDAIRQRHIVVATPEKIDFALRNDPSLSMM